MTANVIVIKDGYSEFNESTKIMRANCTCTLVRLENVCLIVDPLSAWDKEFLVKKLEEEGVSPEDVTHVVCTHGHSDHVGNLNLFLNAIHIVGQCVSQGDLYWSHSFQKDDPYKICDDIHIIGTPGHTSSDVSVIVSNSNYGKVVIAGDLFERENDIEEPSLWKDIAGSENPKLQTENRQYILNTADYIIPGHGPMFKVTDKMRETHSMLFYQMIAINTDINVSIPTVTAVIPNTMNNNKTLMGNTHNKHYAEPAFNFYKMIDRAKKYNTF